MMMLETDIASHDAIFYTAIFYTFKTINKVRNALAAKKTC